MSVSNFDCAKLLQVKIKMDAIWADAQAKAQYEAMVDALTVIKSNQRGMSFPDLEDPTKDKKVKVMWLTDCATDEISDCSSDCEISGDEIGDDCKDYELTMCKEISFKVGRRKYMSSLWSPEEVVARAMLSKMQKMDEYIVQQIVGKLDVYAAMATNRFVKDYMTQQFGNTEIPATYWTSALMGYFYETAIKNRMRDAYLLSGDNLFMTNWNAQQNAGNDNGSGDQKKMTTFQKYFDLFNIDSVLGVNKTFMVRPGSVAFVSKNFNQSSTPQPVGGKVQHDLYYVNSKNLPFIKYDVVHTLECEEDLTNSTKTEYVDTWKIKFYGDLLLNPSNCDGTNNGLLSFICS